ncbi:MAG: hypothetical protein ABI355_04500 [Solirubrobacteraceae bacterium]
MNDPVEAQLRAAFEAKLRGVSPEREARLRAFDYRSRTTRHRQQVWAIVGASSTALAGAIVAAVLILSSGASAAYGWTPIPTTPTPAALKAAVASCNWLNRGTNPSLLTGTPALTDARGKYTAAIYRGRATSALCISDGQHRSTSLATTRGKLPSDVNVGPDQLGSPRSGADHLPGFPGSKGPGQPGLVNSASGPAGSGVSAVTFTFSDGSKVRATVENGLYFAWWPNGNTPATVTTKTNSGDRSSPYQAPLATLRACQDNPGGCVFASAHPGQRSR